MFGSLFFKVVLLLLTNTPNLFAHTPTTHTFVHSPDKQGLITFFTPPNSIPTSSLGFNHAVGMVAITGKNATTVSNSGGDEASSASPLTTSNEGFSSSSPPVLYSPSSTTLLMSPSSSSSVAANEGRLGGEPDSSAYSHMIGLYDTRTDARANYHHHLNGPVVPIGGDLAFRGSLNCNHAAASGSFSSTSSAYNSTFTSSTYVSTSNKKIIKLKETRNDGNP